MPRRDTRLAPPRLARASRREARGRVDRRLVRHFSQRRSARPSDYAELLLTPGVGARTVRALAHVAEVVHGAPSRFSDPARFSLAHGGKDGHPFPVPLRVYDETIRVMKDAVSRAKLGNADRLHAIRALDERARVLERAVEDVDFEGFVEDEKAKSPERDGRTVVDG